MIAIDDLLGDFVKDLIDSKRDGVLEQLLVMIQSRRIQQLIDESVKAFYIGEHRLVKRLALFIRNRPSIQGL